MDLNFGENAFDYEISINKEEDEKEKVCTVLNDNIGLWLGYNSLENVNAPIQSSSELMIQGQTQDKYENEDSLHGQETYDSFDEEKYIMILWRFDEGLGSKIFDLTENQNTGKILKDKVPLSNENAAYVWRDSHLEPGTPLLFEDEWGKE